MLLFSEMISVTQQPSNKTNQQCSESGNHRQHSWHFPFDIISKFQTPWLYACCMIRFVCMNSNAFYMTLSTVQFVFTGAILLVISTAVSVLVERLHKQGHRGQSPPRWVVNVLLKLPCIHSAQKPIQQSVINQQPTLPDSGKV